jgi:hypothetical protein
MAKIKFKEPSAQWTLPVPKSWKGVTVMTDQGNYAWCDLSYSSGTITVKFLRPSTGYVKTNRFTGKIKVVIDT